MSYLQTVQEVRVTAHTVNPNGRFDHGRKVDASQSFEGAFPLIFLYAFTTNLPSPGAEPFDSSTLLIGFFMQDRPDTKPAEREEIIGKMDILSDRFIAEIMKNKTIGLTGTPTKEPQYQLHQATVSGYGVRLTLLTPSPCID